MLKLYYSTPGAQTLFFYWFAGSAVAAMDAASLRTGSMTITELQEQVERSRQALLDVNAALRRAQERQRRSQNRRDLEDGRQKTARGLLSMALLVYVLADHQVSIAVSYIASQEARRRRMCPNRNRQTVQAEVEEAYVKSPVEKLATLLEEPADLPDKRKLVMAAKYVVEHHLFEWLLHRNCRKGVAPSSQQMLQHASTCIPSGAPASVQEALRFHFAAGGRATRKWLASFRQRWGARLGKMKIRDNMDADEVREKARACCRHVLGCLLRLLQFCSCFQTPKQAQIASSFLEPFLNASLADRREASLFLRNSFLVSQIWSLFLESFSGVQCSCFVEP